MEQAPGPGYLSSPTSARLAMLLTGSPGQNLLPVLKARIQAVDDAVDGMFGDTLTSGRAVRVTHAEGWYSGDSQRV